MALAVTGALLVWDLKRPERFWTILTRPQWRSWLARGAFIITAYGGLLTVWTWGAWRGNQWVLTALAWPLAVLAILTSVYTAFLFAQCEGRDLWQDRRLFAHLVLHPVIAGMAVLIVGAPLLAGIAMENRATSLILATGLVAFLALGVSDVAGGHRTANAVAAAGQLRSGRQARIYWTALIGGAALPALLLVVTWPAAGPVAALLALGGLWLHAHALVLAGQGPPIS
jgi:formate-dependent nitrite reductase membrane component NrfD